MLSQKLQEKLQSRKDSNSIRKLCPQSTLVDFSSNDYLGAVNDIKFARLLASAFKKALKSQRFVGSGATGSRLLTGNYMLLEELETLITNFHQSETALIYNSGYTANLGFFQCVPQRGDIILYDELVHASIRDGIKMSYAKAYKFEHNSLNDLSRLLSKHTNNSLPLGEMSAAGGQRGSLGQSGSLGEMFAESEQRGNKGNDPQIYVVTETVFSMDGDSPDITAIVRLCQQYNARLIVDEAHATGVLGTQGQGLIQVYGLENQVFARIITFGKAIGVHGAAILGSPDLRDYLINFSRAFIYTTAMPPHTALSIKVMYQILTEGTNGIVIDNLRSLKKNINIFKSMIPKKGLAAYFIPSVSAIQCAVIPNVEKVKSLSRKLAQQGYDVKPILSPTVPKGQERLRFCLHSYNTKEEIIGVLDILKSEVDV